MKERLLDSDGLYFEMKFRRVSNKSNLIGSPNKEEACPFHNAPRWLVKACRYDKGERKPVQLRFFVIWYVRNQFLKVRTTYRINEPFLVGATYKSTTERRTLRIQTLVCICIYLFKNTHICLQIDFAIN